LLARAGRRVVVVAVAKSLTTGPLASVPEATSRDEDRVAVVAVAVAKNPTTVLRLELPDAGDPDGDKAAVVAAAIAKSLTTNLLFELPDAGDPDGDKADVVAVAIAKSLTTNLRIIVPDMGDQDAEWEDAEGPRWFRQSTKVAASDRSKTPSSPKPKPAKNRAGGAPPRPLAQETREDRIARRL
jgi:hypothetical protein